MFNSNISKFVDWRDRMSDHAGSKNPEWRDLLKYACAWPTDILPQQLLTWKRGPYTDWDLSNFLCSFICRYLGPDLYRSRVILAGNTEGNGFQLWRQLYLDWEGGDVIVQDAGRTEL